MLALKMLLTVAGTLLLATALAIPLFTFVNLIRRARKAAAEGYPEPIIEAGKIPWRGPLALALVAFLPLLIAASIVVVPSGMGAVRISQVSGTLPGTLYPGMHFITPLVESVETFEETERLPQTSLRPEYEGRREVDVFFSSFLLSDLAADSLWPGSREEGRRKPGSSDCSIDGRAQHRDGRDDPLSAGSEQAGQRAGPPAAAG